VWEINASNLDWLQVLTNQKRDMGGKGESHTPPTLILLLLLPPRLLLRLLLLLLLDVGVVAG